MKTLPAVLAMSAGLIFALWWSVQPPFHLPEQSTTVRQQRQAQCPANSTANGKHCVCPSGTVWNGASCNPAARPHIVSERMPAEPHADNCVHFARERVPSLPYGLHTWNAKLDVVNSKRPQPGSVAMIRITHGAYKDVGHVAIVEAVSDTSLTIIEGNYVSGTVTRRTATGRDLTDAERQLFIVGYFNAGFPRPQPDKLSHR